MSACIFMMGKSGTDLAIQISKLWRKNTNLYGELLQVGDAGVHLLHEHLELGDGLGVGQLLGVWRPGAAEEHVQERPDPDLPLDLLVALEGVLSGVKGYLIF